MAISEERKAQLLGLVKQIKAGQSAGALTTGERAKKAGIAGPIDKTTFGKLAGAQIAETAPGEERAATGFGQAGEERERGRKLFGGLLGGEEVAGRREVPTGITEEGAIETKFEQTPEARLSEKQAEADIEVDKQVKAQQQKDISDTRQDLTNARLKIGTAFDSWLSAIDRTKRLTGVDPGVFGGVITEVLGKSKANEFVNAFKGGLVEYAAAVGRIAMPGARATRLINLFKTTAPTTFDTVPSAIEQSALSFRNGLATAMSREPDSFLPDFSGSDEDFNQLDTMLRDFQNTYREGLLKLSFDKNPELLPPDTRTRFEAEQRGEIVSGVSDDEINAFLDRLGAE